MKKIFLICMVFFGSLVHAQKTFVVYNLTTTTMSLYDIITNASGVYPQFQSKGTTVTIPPGGSYTLQNLAHPLRFPFHSPSSSPFISNWVRTVPPVTIATSMAAWFLGAPQVFSSLSFGESGFGSGIITPTSGPISWSGVGTAWTADYVMIVSPTNPNDITYMITIM